MQIQFTSIADEDVESFRESLDVVAREPKYLALWKHHQIKTFEGSSQRTSARRARKSSHATALG